MLDGKRLFPERLLALVQWRMLRRLQQQALLGVADLTPRLVHRLHLRVEEKHPVLSESKRATLQNHLAAGLNLRTLPAWSLLSPTLLLFAAGQVMLLGNQ